MDVLVGSQQTISSAEKWVEQCYGFEAVQNETRIKSWDDLQKKLLPGNPESE
jgi:hypothetical protein